MYSKNLGNIEIEAGKKYDTGSKYRDSNGVARPIKVAFVDFGALPNAATKNVAHGLDLDPAFADAEVLANDGTTSKKGSAVTVDATNVSVTEAGDESAFVNGLAIIHYIEPLS